ncbi:MAG: type II toxin-antitoxin system prevent-host-death family antitoxin [Thermodesulfobacteriota bacterium]|nr:type II toxin-antitoxin system prevent-host-death family antitoxin [Thermodesulfobacteriota bacterium]
MGIITAKQLKIKTGEVIRRVKSGEHLTITYRGKPVGIILPSEERKKDETEKLRPYDEAWKGIEESLAKIEPAFKGWQEATAWVRSRH